MPSRQELCGFIHKHFHPDAIRAPSQTSLTTDIAEILGEHQVSTSDFCRLIFLDERLRLMAELPQQISAPFRGI
jgi:hypothetical protein